MPRWLLTGVFLVLASSWSNSAFAQYGGMGGNNHKDPIEEIDSQRSKQKQQRQTYAKAVVPRASAPARSYLGNPASLDAYGRIDMSGRAAPGYPTVRGDFTGPTTISPIRPRARTSYRRNSAVARRTTSR